MEKPLSDAQRQQRRREKLRREYMKPLLVKGVDGEYDERIRIALAIKSLAANNKLSNEFIDLIAKEAEDVFPSQDNINKKYINQIVKNYLKE